MKAILTILFIIFSLALSATNYHIKTGGDDAANGDLTHPWATITKVNAVWAAGTFATGDSICFNKGDTFYGTITITESGSSVSSIIVGAYGTGIKPIITGFTTITGWTNEGSGRYSKVISSEALTNMATIDGIQVKMGRTPDATYNTYESHSGDVSITDTGLGTSTNWTGAEVVIKKDLYTLQRCLITDHTGDVLTYSNTGTAVNGTNNHGYFFQNDLRCVTTTNEWFHDYFGTGKFYIYGDPSAKVVKVATLNYLVYNAGNDYITIDGIDFEGSINDAINFGNYSDICKITNCNISFSGRYGIYLAGGNPIITNNYINDVNSGAILSTYASTGVSTITDNTIIRVGYIVGQSFATQHNFGCAIWNLNGATVNISSNNIQKVAYNGIVIGSTASTIQYNVIDSCCLGLDDGAGIYVTNPGLDSVKIIDHNIVTNTLGNREGTNGGTSISCGICLDDYATNVTVSNNTTSGCFYGIKLHNAYDNTVKYNSCFNNVYGVDFENTAVANYVTNDSIFGNNFIAKESTQYTVKYYNSYSGYATSFSTMYFDQNYYARPIDDNLTFGTYLISTWASKTLSQWKTLIGQDANSQKSPIAVADTADIDFYYNSTNVNSVISLAVPMTTVAGTKYKNQVTLTPFTSVILMVDPTPSATGSMVRGANGKIMRVGGKLTIKQ